LSRNGPGTKYSGLKSRGLQSSERASCGHHSMTSEN